MLYQQGDIKAPMVFAAKNAVKIFDYPQEQGSLWKATVKAAREGEASRIFEDILFFEEGSLAGIVGIESESGLPEDLPAEQASKQQKFIQFLRDERQRKLDSLGLVARIFEGWEYSVEAAATASFMAIREGLTDVAIGYFDDSGEYQRERIAAGATGNDWLEMARRTRSYDSLD